ncbi:glycosyl hydrolase family 8 [Mycolicibacterium sp. P1-5]|uniref:glycosyl hydrolase family 8 n=1 Tax=Mycolicibacterium sp. P1-5 TaxID=2024617 RepID=UPI0011EEFF75|nr:glycosyl hydrolase family 8 [Mycolicibacterium sp. P1-5]KAA0108951.1 glycoside hydrolase [Mycolicibacterium sp. P1-5]
MQKRIRAVAVQLLVLALAIGAGFVVARTVDPRIFAGDIHRMREQAARHAGKDFLDHYVERDGRVVRRDEGGDVVSEGQAYGMLISVALGDKSRFHSIWKWTKANLRRPDGLLSWRWTDGHVTDPNSASDADLDMARALLLAGRRFDDATLSDEGKQLGGQVLRLETAEVGATTPPPGDAVPAGQWIAGAGPITVAGNWATAPPHVVDPGYFNPRAAQQMQQASGDARWTDVNRTQRVLSWQLSGPGQLPPDWAVVDDVGHAVPTAPPAGGTPQFGLDAARLPIRYAESCDPADRSLAASLRQRVAAPGDVPALRNLDGTAASDWQHPVALVSAAATDHAAGDDDAGAARLDQASALQQRYPTYFGAAWVALGRIMLDTTLLGHCAD